jgi:hypothetical protein
MAGLLRHFLSALGRLAAPKWHEVARQILQHTVSESFSSARRVRKSTADEETDLNGFANPMAKGAYVEDGWVDESAASSGPGFFGALFGGGGSKSAGASKLAARDRLNAELDVIEFVDGSKGSLTDAARGGTAVPFGGLNPAQVEAYDMSGESSDGDSKTPWGGYAPMPESAVEFFIKYPEKGKAKPLPAGWYSAMDETSGQEYYYTEDGTTTWERPTA